MIETFRALAEPNRFQIVELLLSGARPVGELVDRLGLRQPQVSKHLRVLSDAGLWTSRGRAAPHLRLTTRSASRTGNLVGTIPGTLGREFSAP
jgi:DNA-binding transcriptional ArsR family regulator